MTLRDDIVANALWGVANEMDVHYSQGPRRMEGIGHPRMLPLYTDCSAFATLCYAWAGAPDPNGLGFNGSGFTGTLLTGCDHIDPADAQPGDLIVYGPGAGDHVVLIIEPGPDPLTVSHGQEAGPAKVRHSVEARAHRPPATFLRCAGLDNGGLHMDQDVQAQFDAIALRQAQTEQKVEHIEAMLGSAITVINAIKAKTGA